MFTFTPSTIKQNELCVCYINKSIFLRDMTKKYIIENI